MARTTLAQRLNRWFGRNVSDPIKYRRRARLNRKRQFHPLFVTGAMGSGTTLLSHELGQRHAFAAVIPESAIRIASTSVLHSRAIASFDSISAYERSVEPLPSWRVDTAIEDMTALYRMRADPRPGSPDLIVDKAANTHMLRAEFLLECFPESSMMAIFRDPRANIEGFRRKWPTFGNDSVDENIRFYLRIHDALLAAARRHPQRILLIEYESLVAEPAGTLEPLTKRLGLTASTRSKKPGARPNQPGKGLRNVKAGQIRIVQDANARSIERLGPDLARRIEREVSELHARLREHMAPKP